MSKIEAGRIAAEIRKLGRVFNEDVLKAAIRSGRIKGTTRGEGLTSETAIAAESGEIEDYLKRDGGKLFTNPVVLRRVLDR